MLTEAQAEAAKVEIEKGIPIPEGTKYGHWTIVAEKMEVGNSVHIKLETVQKSTQRALGLKNALRKAGKDCVSRTMDGGVRVWCTKAPKKPKTEEAPPPANGQAA